MRGYELKSILSQSGFGIAYRARNTTLDRDVTIKEYLPTSLAIREGPHHGDLHAGPCGRAVQRGDA